MRHHALLAALLAALPVAGAGPASAVASLRFGGTGVGDIDRVKIRIDDPATALPGPPADLGATDFTIECWLRALPGANAAPTVTCGANVDWILGNIVVDRDRYNQDRKFGISLAGGRVVFGVSGDGTGDWTVCGTRVVDDGAWHHLAVDRRRADGRMRLWVDGVLEASADGPDGDISYPDDAVPGPYCGGPCLGSDPFLVLGAEKHDAGPAYPSFTGWLDELRLSATLRYDAPFTPPAAPFVADAATLALYPFDEGVGDTLHDVAGAPGGPSHGLLRIGGTPSGPAWDTDRFAALPVPVVTIGTRVRAWPTPARAQVRWAGLPPGDIEVVDAHGRVLHRLHAPAGEAAWDLRDARGARVPPGLYLVRAVGGGTAARTVVVR
jgi:hypothetical protein